ncbi:MAG: hypothetical protein M3524_04330, partial [Actinomycetota bacterium]|nr:hypothetical protein [Actinomycetota bacterium]
REAAEVERRAAEARDLAEREQARSDAQAEANAAQATQEDTQPDPGPTEETGAITEDGEVKQQ